MSTASQAAAPSTPSQKMPQRIDIIFIRHGKTTDNEHEVMSGGGRDPELLQEGKDGADKANEVYKVLEKQGIVNAETPVYVTNTKRSKETGARFTGKDAEKLKVDDDFLERGLGKYDGVMTERFQQKEAKNAGFIFEGEEKTADHTARVNKALNKAIKEGAVPDN